MAELTRDEFRRLLDRRGLKLEGKAFEAAFDGACHLRAEIRRVALWLSSEAGER